MKSENFHVNKTIIMFSSNSCKILHFLSCRFFPLKSREKNYTIDARISFGRSRLHGDSKSV